MAYLDYWSQSASSVGYPLENASNYYYYENASNYYYYENASNYYYYERKYDIYHLTGKIDKYSIPVIFTLGIPANLVAAVVFLSKTFRQASFGVNLVGKCLSDTLFLVCTLVVWLESIDVHLLHTPGVCRAVVYLTFVSAFTSVWFVVALALDNLIRIRYPFWVTTMCQPRKASAITGVMVCLACTIYFPTLWFNSPIEIDRLPICQQNMDMAFVSAIYSLVDSSIRLIIPSVLVATFLGMTIVSVCTSTARSLRMFHDARVSLSVVKQQQVTQMLFTVSVTFIMLAFPSHITRMVLLVIVWNNDVSITGEQYLAQHILQLLYYLSFAINLLSYVAFCPKVRTALVGAVKCACLQVSSEQVSIHNVHSVVLTNNGRLASYDTNRNKTCAIPEAPMKEQNIHLKLKACCYTFASPQSSPV